MMPKLPHVPAGPSVGHMSIIWTLASQVRHRALLPSASAMARACEPDASPSFSHARYAKTTEAPSDVYWAWKVETWVHGRLVVGDGGGGRVVGSVREAERRRVWRVGRALAAFVAIAVRVCGLCWAPCERCIRV